jgi:sulfatase modifying factor 1
MNTRRGLLKHLPTNSNSRTCLLALIVLGALNGSNGSNALVTTSHAQSMRGTMDRTEVTVGAFAKFAQATGFVSQAEKQGWSLTYEGGWAKRDGWNWAKPYGQSAAPDEPAVHLNFDEAQAYCRWADKRLPKASEWRLWAYTEQRSNPPAPFVTGQTYPYPTGNSPQGAHCLGDCGNRTQGVAHAQTSRGVGHALTGTSTAGVNGLFDMGGNAWEWATGDNPAAHEQPTLGGSWWYGATPMHRDHRATKPRDLSVVYVGFRCFKP